MDQASRASYVLTIEEIDDKQPEAHVLEGTLKR